MSALDPFYLVKEEIQNSIAEVNASLRQWKQLPSTAFEKESMGKKLLSSCETIGWQVDELERATAVAERDPVRFQITSVEILRRKQWTDVARNQIVAIKTTLYSFEGFRRPVPNPFGETRNEFVNVPTTKPKPNLIEQQNSDFIEQESQRQALALKEQDEDLDELSLSVERLGNVGLTIHEELGSQEVMIDDLGREIDVTANRLEYVTKKMEVLIKKAGAKGQITMIVFLVVLLAILVMLILYT